MNIKNPNLWSVVSCIVAIFALILSQLPPIRQIVRGTDIRITTPEVISLWHDFGNIHVEVPIDIYNAGGTTVNVSKVECTILEKDTGKLFPLPARTYYNENNCNCNLSLGTITLSSDQHWSHDVEFFNSFTRSELEQINDLRARIHTDVVDKRDKLPRGDKNNWILLDDKLYQESINFFNKKFELIREGNYQFFIKAVSDSGEIVRVQGFDLTLFKSNIQELRGMAERDYKYAAGIEGPTRYTRSAINIPITPMNENDSKIEGIG